MVNIDKLRGKMVEKRISADCIAHEMGVDKSTFYRRLSDNGSTFSIAEADAIVSALSLTLEEATAIFFAQYVA